MGLRRTISTSFWTDTWVETLTPTEKLAFVYLFSSPGTNPAGLYELSTRRMRFDTGLSEEETMAALGKFERDGRIMYDGDASVVWVCQFRRYHGTESPNWLKGVQAAVEKIPECAPKRAYLEAWPLETVRPALPDEDDRSDGGGSPTVLEDRRRSTIVEDGVGHTGKVAISQSQSQGQGQGQGQSQLEGQCASTTDVTELADPFFQSSENPDLKPHAEGKKALIRSAIAIWENYQNAALSGTDNMTMLQFVGEHGARAVLEACQVTRDYKPKKSFGGYLRTVLENGARERDPPSQVAS